MSGYNAKNYTEQGGDKTVIGGTLEFTGGARVIGFPGAANQAASTASTVKGLADDFNALLVNLKNAGVMIPDAWNLTAALAPSPTDAAVAANNALAESVTLADGVITIAVDVDALTESASSDPAQGTHKWLCLGIGTGLPSVTAVSCNGAPLTEQDVSDAAACGCGAGTFVLYFSVRWCARVAAVDATGYRILFAGDVYDIVSIDHMNFKRKALEIQMPEGEPMSRRVDVSGLADAVIEELKEYADLAATEMKAAVKKAGTQVRKEISDNAPVRTGAYAKSWAAETTGKTSTKLPVTVHSRNCYQIARLLEHGHAKRGGGRVPGRPHIAPAKEQGAETLEREIRRALEG